MSFQYQGTQVTIGTYTTQDDAAKANKAARLVFAPLRGKVLSDKAIEANFKLAKVEAAKVATATWVQILEQVGIEDEEVF